MFLFDQMQVVISNWWFYLLVHYFSQLTFLSKYLFSSCSYIQLLSSLFLRFSIFSCCHHLSYLLLISQLLFFNLLFIFLFFFFFFSYWRFHDEFHSIFPMGDISALIPDDEADVCVLEEPEHLNWWETEWYFFSLLHNIFLHMFILEFLLFIVSVSCFVWFHCPSDFLSLIYRLFFTMTLFYLFILSCKQDPFNFYHLIFPLFSFVFFHLYFPYFCMY